MGWSPTGSTVWTLRHDKKGMNMQGHFNRPLLGLNLNARRIKDCTGRTHPGTEHGPVRGRLMLSMVSGVFSRLRLCQTTDGKNTEHESY